MNLVEALKSGKPIRRKGSAIEKYHKPSPTEVFSVDYILSDWEVEPVYLKATASKIKEELEKAYIPWIMQKYRFSDIILDKFKTRCKVERDQFIFTEEQALKIVLSVMGNKADELPGSSDRFIEAIEDLQIWNG